MKFLLITVALVAVASAGIIKPGPTGPAPIIDYEPIAVGPAIIDDVHDIAVGPAIIDDVHDIAVGPAIIDDVHDIAVGPAIIDDVHDIAVGPAIIEGPVEKPSQPLVNIIININSQSPASTPEVVEIAPTPVIIEEEPIKDPSPPAVIGVPVLPIPKPSKH